MRHCDPFMGPSGGGVSGGFVFPSSRSPARRCSEDAEDARRPRDVFRALYEHGVVALARRELLAERRAVEVAEAAEAAELRGCTFRPMTRPPPAAGTSAAAPQQSDVFTRLAVEAVRQREAAARRAAAAREAAVRREMQPPPRPKKPQRAGARSGPPHTLSPPSRRKPVHVELYEEASRSAAARSRSRSAHERRMCPFRPLAGCSSAERRRRAEMQERSHRRAAEAFAVAEAERAAAAVAAAARQQTATRSSSHDGSARTRQQAAPQRSSASLEEDMAKHCRRLRAPPVESMAAGARRRAAREGARRGHDASGLSSARVSRSVSPPARAPPVEDRPLTLDEL